jgi:hypothetical protein
LIFVTVAVRRRRARPREMLLMGSSVEVERSADAEPGTIAPAPNHSSPHEADDQSFVP